MLRAMTRNGGVVMVTFVSGFILPEPAEHREMEAEARKRIDPGMTGARVTDAIGKPSFSVRTQGVSAHDIWTYYFTDGTLTINLTDGYVARVATEFGPPRPGRPRRP